MLALWKAESTWPHKRRLTNRFKDEYGKATKKEKKLILDRLAGIGMGRSTVRRLLSKPAAPMGKGRPGRPRKPGSGRKSKHSQGSGRLLERLRMLMGMLCGLYMKAMIGQWISALEASDELTGATRMQIDAVGAMSSSTIDHRLKTLRLEASPKGRSPTRSSACPGWPRPTPWPTADPARPASSRAPGPWSTMRPTGP